MASKGALVADRLDSWKEIATYVNRSVRTVIRWESTRGLPVHRIPGGERQGVFAYRHEIDSWLQIGTADEDLAELDDPALAEPAPPADSAQAIAIPVPRARLRPGILWTAGLGTIVLAAISIAWSRLPTEQRFTAFTQITADGVSKFGLVTDGTTLYFSERRHGGYVLSEVSVQGGPIRAIPTRLSGPVPVSISPDGGKLLLLDWDDEQAERSLWTVSVQTGAASPVDSIRCHSAAWSPDGKRIAYATGSSIYLFENAAESLLQTLPGIPRLLRWTADGRRIRFELRDAATSMSDLWELQLSGEGSGTVELLSPLRVTADRGFDGLTALDGNSSMVTVDGPVQDRLRLVKESWTWSGARYKLVRPNTQLSGAYNLASDPAHHRLFALTGFTTSNELVRYQPITHDFKPFLPALGARDLDFSRDGKRIAYLTIGEDSSLWIGRADGTQQHRVDFHALDLELPHWSPDGRWVAFMAMQAGRPWRLFVVSSDGGVPRPIANGSDGQGAATWSPDSRVILYGNVQCQESANCAIHKVDLSTGKSTTVSGSEGLGTSRWSPDGRYVAALDPRQHKVMLLDVTSGAWRKLADGVNGNDLSWSADSAYVYASRIDGGGLQVMRIAVVTGEAELAVDLSDFSNLPGRVDTWFALVPDGSILFNRWQDESEIYSLQF